MIESIGLYPRLFDCDLQTIFAKNHTFFKIDRKDHTHDQTANNQYWHREETTDEIYPSIMVWANVFPTEIRYPCGIVTSPRENELVLIDNRQLQHRAPQIPIERIAERRFIMVRFLKATPTIHELAFLRIALEGAA